ncbi:MAG: hypothetical protein EZS28_014151, partial [Streblomastix strix]
MICSVRRGIRVAKNRAASQRLVRNVPGARRVGENNKIPFSTRAENLDVDFATYAHFRSMGYIIATLCILSIFSIILMIMYALSSPYEKSNHPFSFISMGNVAYSHNEKDNSPIVFWRLLVASGAESLFILVSWGGLIFLSRRLKRHSQTRHETEFSASTYSLLVRGIPRSRRYYARERERERMRCIEREERIKKKEKISEMEKQLEREMDRSRGAEREEGAVRVAKHFEQLAPVHSCLLLLPDSGKNWDNLLQSYLQRKNSAVRSNQNHSPALIGASHSATTSFYAPPNTANLQTGATADKNNQQPSAIQTSSELSRLRKQGEQDIREAMRVQRLVLEGSSTLGVSSSLSLKGWIGEADDLDAEDQERNKKINERQAAKELEEKAELERIRVAEERGEFKHKADERIRAAELQKERKLKGVDQQVQKDLEKIRLEIELKRAMDKMRIDRMDTVDWRRGKYSSTLDEVIVDDPEIIIKDTRWKKLKRRMGMTIDRLFFISLIKARLSQRDKLLQPPHVQIPNIPSRALQIEMYENLAPGQTSSSSVSATQGLSNSQTSISSSPIVQLQTQGQQQRSTSPDIQVAPSQIAQLAQQQKPQYYSLYPTKFDSDIVIAPPQMVSSGNKDSSSEQVIDPLDSNLQSFKSNVQQMITTVMQANEVLHESIIGEEDEEAEEADEISNYKQSQLLIDIEKGKKIKQGTNMHRSSRNLNINSFVCNDFNIQLSPAVDITSNNINYDKEEKLTKFPKSLFKSSKTTKKQTELFNTFNNKVFNIFNYNIETNSFVIRHNNYPSSFSSAQTIEQYLQQSRLSSQSQSQYGSCCAYITFETLEGKEKVVRAFQKSDEKMILFESHYLISVEEPPEPCDTLMENVGIPKSEKTKARAKTEVISVFSALLVVALIFV